METENIETVKETIECLDSFYSKWSELTIDGYIFDKGDSDVRRTINSIKNLLIDNSKCLHESLIMIVSSGYNIYSIGNAIVGIDSMQKSFPGTPPVMFNLNNGEGCIIDEMVRKINSIL